MAYRFQDPKPKQAPVPGMGLNAKPAPSLQEKLKTAQGRPVKNANNGSFRGNSTQPVTQAPKKPMWKSFKTSMPVGGAAGKAKLMQAGGKF